MKYCIWMTMAMLAGCTSPQPAGRRPAVEFRIGETSPREGLTEYTVLGSEQKVYLNDQAAMTEADIVSAQMENPPHGVQVKIRLTKPGRKHFADLTGANLEKPLAILVDGIVITAPIINERIPGGVASIHLMATKEEARRIVRQINGIPE